MTRPKLKNIGGHLLIYVFLTLSALTFMSGSASAAVTTGGGSTSSASTGSGATCDPNNDWYCHGVCDFKKNPAVAKDPNKVSSCKCDGTPNLTGDALLSCTKCNDPSNQNGCLQNNPITKRINQIIYFLSGLVAVVITANVIVGGIQYAVSGESANAVQAAKRRMVNSAIAFLVFILTFSLLQWLIPGGL